MENNTKKPMDKVTLRVRNKGSRVVQVGSQFHFFEVSDTLDFDRERAYGCRLDIPSATAMRFEPGCDVEIELVPYTAEAYTEASGPEVHISDWVLPDMFQNRLEAWQRI